MPSTFSSALRVELIGDNEQAGAWGQTTNRNFTQVLEEAITATTEVDVTASDATLTAINGGSDQSRRPYILVGGAPVVPRVISVANVSKNYMVKNATGQDITFKGIGQTGVVIPKGETGFIRLIKDNPAQIVRIAALGGPAGFTQVKMEGSTTDQLLLVNQTDPTGPIAKFQAAGVDVVTIGPGAASVFKGTVSFPDVAGGGFLPLAGGILSGNVRESRTVFAEYAFNVTDAPVDKHYTVWQAGSNNEMRLGHLNDAQDTWQGGLLLKADQKLYDIATGRPLAVETPTGGYLPLSGGILSGDLAITRPTPGLLFTATDAPANKRRLLLQSFSDGASFIGKTNDTGSAWTAGIYISAAGELQNFEGRKIWHEGNDGANTGLDADYLWGQRPSQGIVGNSIAQRNGSGDLVCNNIYAPGGLNGGPGNAGRVLGYGGNSFTFRWDGTFLVRVDEAVELRLLTTQSMPFNRNSVGYLELGNGFIMQWGEGYVGIDSHTIFNLPRPWSVGIAGWACPNVNVNMVGGSIIGTNILWMSATQIAVGIGDQGWGGGVQVKWFCIGY